MGEVPICATKIKQIGEVILCTLWFFMQIQSYIFVSYCIGEAVPNQSKNRTDVLWHSCGGCNPLILRPKLSGGVQPQSVPGRTPPLEHHERGHGLY